MIVLDTHAWWWAVSEPSQLSRKARQLINKTPPDQRTVASISIWEFAMMVARGRIHLTITPEEWLDHAICRTGLTILDLNPQIALESCKLPGTFHRDPADRIIVATARVYQSQLITKDQKISDYPFVTTVW
jgi:PIN domain nuclease of toxin-antitoxin system